MNIMRWEPWQEFASLREAMNRLEETFTQRMGFPWRDGHMLAWQPSVDVIENETEILVKADLPGVDPQNLEVTLTDDSVSLKGEMQQDKEVKEENYYRRERRFGSFSRVIPLNKQVLPDSARADFKNGVLEIRVKKAEPAKGKQVKINLQ